MRVCRSWVNRMRVLFTGIVFTGIVFTGVGLAVAGVGLEQMIEVEGLVMLTLTIPMSDISF